MNFELSTGGNEKTNHRAWLIFAGKGGSCPLGGMRDCKAGCCRKGLVFEWLEDESVKYDWIEIYDNVNNVLYSLDKFHDEFGN